MPRKVIVFDLWETLATKQISVSRTLCRRFAIAFTADMLRRYELAVQCHAWGSMEMMAVNFLQAFGIDVNDENIAFTADTFNSAIRQAVLFPGVYSLLRDLVSRDHRPALLSNTTVFESGILESWGLAEGMFAAQVFSWQTGHLKPDRPAFDAVLQALDTCPENAIFIDDTAANIAAASLLGFQTIHFQGVYTCRRALSDAGCFARS